MSLTLVQMEPSIRNAALIRKFLLTVGNRSSEIDPTDEHLWSSLILGWCLGQGLEPTEAGGLAELIEDSLYG